MAWGACAQTEQAQRVLDSLSESRPKFMPRSLQLNYNVLRMGEVILAKPQQSQEIQAELGIHKFFLVADFGTSTILRGDEYTYQNDGTYWRVGADVNMSKSWQENMIGLGLRYCQAQFSDRATFERELLDGSTQIFDLNNPDLRSRWAELVFKMRVKLWKGLSTGYTMRYQFFEYTPGLEDSQLRPFDIPGYGKTNRPNSFQFDYYVGWRFDF